MPCLLALLALISPRLVLVPAVDLQQRSQPCLQQLDPAAPRVFSCSPWMMLAYAAFWSWGPGHHVTGFEWFFVVLAFLIDLGSYGGGRFAAANR